MCGISNKSLVTGLVVFLLSVHFNVQAEINPFKKTKNHHFGSDIGWYEKRGSAMKSGAVRDGSNTLFYHLNISPKRILLRLGKNDPSGELENTRPLDKMAITDVLVDGRRLPLFDRCLNNQQEPGRKLKQNAIVANDICVNAGGRGDFVIHPDAGTRKILMHAKTIEFVVEPYGRPVKLKYDMAGYAPIMAEITKPAPAPVKAKPPAAKAAVKAKPEPKPVAKPVAKPKPKPKPKKVKMCNLEAPAEFQSEVKAVAYPCDNAEKKLSARAKVDERVNRARQKREAKLEAERKKQEAAQKPKQKTEDDKRVKEWDKKQDQLWISRCKRHWDKGRSPCYCEKYMDLAPPGVNNTCGN